MEPLALSPEQEAERQRFLARQSEIDRYLVGSYRKAIAIRDKAQADADKLRHQLFYRNIDVDDLPGYLR